MKQNGVITEMSGSVCIIRIDRPETNNKLSIPCMSEVKRVLEEKAADAACRSVIIAGGDEFFCSGGELGDFRKKSPMEIKEFGAAFIRLHTAIVHFPKPVIAAVEGNAFGGGFSLVEACDLAVGAEDALFAIPEILGGLAPAMGLSGIFSQMTKKEVMAIGLMGETLTSEQVLKSGILNCVVLKQDVMDKAIEIGNFFEDKSPTAVKLFKELYTDMGMNDYENRLHMGQSMMVTLFKSVDGMEVLQAKEENRTPKWCGK